MRAIEPARSRLVMPTLKEVIINTRFTTPEQLDTIMSLSRRMKFIDLMKADGLYAEQVQELYEQLERAGKWKYEKPAIVVEAIGKIPNYHILAAIDPSNDLVLAAVRVVLLKNSNYVFGSCLARAEEEKDSGLAIAMIIAGMSTGERNAIDNGKRGMDGVVLAVERNPAMRQFHDEWGVKFIHATALPFLFPRDDARGYETRTFGIRQMTYVDDRSIDAKLFRRILEDLRDLHIALGYDCNRVEELHAKMTRGLVAGVDRVPLLDADSYRDERVNPNDGVSLIVG